MASGIQTAENNDFLLQQYRELIDTGWQFLENCEEFVNKRVHDTLWNLIVLSMEPSSKGYVALQSVDHLDLFEKFWYGLTENFGSKYPDCCRNPKKDIRKKIFSKDVFKKVFKKERVLRYDTLFEKDSQWPSDEETQVAYICILFLEYFHNISDESDKVCREFGQRNYLEMLLRGLQTEQLPARFVVAITGIIYNCCRKIPENCILCKDGMTTLENLSESQIPNIQSHVLLSLAYIIDKSDIKKISLNKLCTKFLLNALKKALDDPDRRGEGYGVEELVQGIHQLAINDNNKRLIAEHGGIPLLESVLISDEGTNTEKCFAAQGIWQLSFNDKNKLKIQRRKDLMKGKSFNIILSHYGVSLV